MEGDLQTALTSRWPQLEGHLSEHDLQKFQEAGLGSVGLVEAATKTPRLLSEAGLNIGIQAVLEEPSGQQLPPNLFQSRSSPSSG